MEDFFLLFTRLLALLSALNFINGGILEGRMLKILCFLSYDISDQ